MARGVFSLTNHFVYVGGIVAAAPLSMSAWIYPANVTALNGIMQITYTSGANIVLDGFRVAINLTTGYVRASTGDDVSVTSALTAAGVTIEAWNQVGGVFASAASRYAYLNGVASAQDTTSVTPTAPNKASIGCTYLQDNSKAAAAVANYISEVAYWNVALTAAEMLQLATGYSPLFIRPESLVAYYPLIRGDAAGNEPELMGGLKMVEQGTVATAAHPPVRYWAKARIARFHSTIVITHQGAAVLAGAGALITDGFNTANAITAMAGMGSLATNAQMSAMGMIALTGAGQFAINVQLTELALAILTGTGILDATAQEILVASAFLLGSGSLLSDSQKMALAESILSGAGSLFTSAQISAMAQAELSGLGTLSIDGLRTALGKTQLMGTGALDSSGLLTLSGTAQLVGTGALIAQAYAILIAIISLIGSGTLNAMAAVYHNSGTRNLLKALARGANNAASHTILKADG